MSIEVEMLTFIQSVTKLALRLNENSNKFLNMTELAKNLSHFSNVVQLEFQAAVADLDSAEIS